MALISERRECMESLRFSPKEVEMAATASTNVQPDADDKSRAFLDAELQHLRSEDQLLRQEAWRVETYSVGASAAVVAWLATHSVTSRLAWWLPLVIILAAGARFGSMMRHLEYRVRAYVADKEQQVLGDSGGWQHFSKSLSSNQALANWIVWGVLLLAAIWVGATGVVLVSPTSQSSTMV
jgi:hypothetical protein